MKVLKIDLIWDINDIVESKFLWRVAVDENQQILVLTVDPPSKQFFSPKETDSYARISNAFSYMIKAGVPILYTINSYSSQGLLKFSLKWKARFNHIQTIDNSKFLLVDSRSVSDKTPNGYIFNYYDGKPIRKLSLSDGINDVQVAGENIWVSYFDEGVFAKYNRICNAGLACFDLKGKELFRYSSLAGKYKLPFIDDCYSINAINNHELWVYYYMKYPLIKIKDFELCKAYQNFPITGANSMAIAEHQMLFAGDKGYYPGFIYLLNIDSMEVDKIDLIDEKDNIIENYKSFARGTFLYILSENKIYRINVANI